MEVKPLSCGGHCEQMQCVLDFTVNCLYHSNLENGLNFFSETSNLQCFITVLLKTTHLVFQAEVFSDSYPVLQLQPSRMSLFKINPISYIEPLYSRNIWNSSIFLTISKLIQEEIEVYIFM